MRVFVTGASGGIGSAVCLELIAAGHEVLGLARSDASAEALTAAGVSVLRGDLSGPESLRAGALESDGVIHLAGAARRTGISAYVGDGAQRWPAVHRLDAARLYRLAIEKAPAGSRLHAVGEGGVPMRDIAAAIGRVLGVPVTSKSGSDAEAHFGFLAVVGALDQPASSARTRELLGWESREPGLLADLEASLKEGGN